VRRTLLPSLEIEKEIDALLAGDVDLDRQLFERNAISAASAVVTTFGPSTVFMADPPVSDLDFKRPKRGRRQRTGREDRHSNFYEIPDNLTIGELPIR
jgi:hypothetical protein